jgi:hypothetical protein
MSFKQGSLVRLAGPFLDSSQNPVDPTTVYITIARPDGQRNTYQYGVGSLIVKDSTGNYHIDVDASIPGKWSYWWHSTGTAQAADEKSFTVTAAIGADPPGAPQSLAIDYLQITREVGRLLGLSQDRNGWSDQERQDVTDIIRSGLRRFYWSPVLPNGDGKSATVHSWSFLRGRKTISLVAAQNAYDLPDDFGEMIEGGFTPAAGSGISSISLIGEEQMRQLQTVPTATATPQYAAIFKLAGAPVAHQVVFYPTPNAALNSDVQLPHHATGPDGGCAVSLWRRPARRDDPRGDPVGSGAKTA